MNANPSPKFRGFAPLLLLSFFACAPAFGQTALDGFDPKVSGVVRALALQADGSIIIGGSFTNVSGIPRTNLARVNVDGSLDGTFEPAAGGNNPFSSSEVKCLVVQADGKIVVGGAFTILDGQPRNLIGRLNVDGTLDPSFNPMAEPSYGGVYALALQSDGRILIGGFFTSLSGHPRERIARLNADGSLDTSFNCGLDPQSDDVVVSLTVQTDRKILVAGAFRSLGGEPHNSIGRLFPNGSLDTNFNPSANAEVASLAVQVDGKILVGGSFSMLSGEARSRLGRLNADGSLDTTFGNPGNLFGPASMARVESLALQQDGKILVGGMFDMVRGTLRFNMARLQANGDLDAAFNPGANDSVSSLAVQPDGKILVGGDFTTLGGTNRNHLGRLYADGSLDATFNPGAAADPPPNTAVNGFAVQADGKLIIGGTFRTLGGEDRTNLARLNPDGSVGTGFQLGASGDEGSAVHSVAIQNDGRIFVAGTFTNLGGEPRTFLGRLDTDGSVDATFTPQVSFVATPFTIYRLAVDCMTLQPDGKIVIGGSFNRLNGQVRSNIARLNGDGSLDLAFNPGADVSSALVGRVSRLAVQSDGKILVSGLFFSLGGQARTNIGRLNPNGGVDTAFNPVGIYSVACFGVQPDGKILIGGDFAGPDGQWHRGICRLNPDGSFDPTFVLDVIIQSGPIRIVGDAYSLAVQVDGRIIVGGNFNTLGGQSSTNIGRLNLDGSLDPTFHAGASGSVYSLAISADGKILVGGAFSSLAGQPRQSVGRLAPNTASVQKLMIDACGTTVTWIRNGALPEVEQVTFEVSLDGLNFVFVGRGARVNGGWQLAGLALPTGQHFYLRARGRTIGGIYNGSSGLMESVALFYRLPPPFLSSVQVLGGGMFQFYFTNTTATAFTVLASSDLTLQASQWTSLGAPLLVGGGLYQFTDSGATNFTRRFYQLRTP